MSDKIKIEFGQRLKQARLAKKMSMDSLAEALGGKVTKQAISKYETGKMKPSNEVVVELSHILEVETDYFYRPITIDYENLKLSFRKRSSLGAKDVVALTIRMRDDIENFVEISDLLGISVPFVDELFKVSTIQGAEQMEQYAIKLRDSWGIGKQPILSVQDLLESKGVKVMYIDGPDKFDGMSGVVNSNNYVIVLNDNTKMSERWRFTAMHEFGHLLFNQYFSKELTNLDKEKLCHAFASEMLIPGSVLKEKFGGKAKIPVSEFERAQEQYGISIDAIVHKLHRMKLFSDKRYRSFQIRKNTTEHFKNRIETPRFNEEKTPRFKSMVYKALAADLITVSKAAALLKMPVTDMYNDFSLL